MQLILASAGDAVVPLHFFSYDSLQVPFECDGSRIHKGLWPSCVPFAKRPSVFWRYQVGEYCLTLLGMRSPTSCTFRVWLVQRDRVKLTQ
jgi:hypothetical protein